MTVATSPYASPYACDAVSDMFDVIKLTLHPSGKQSLRGSMVENREIDQGISTLIKTLVYLIHAG
jgi:hypothetical protein